ncbi:MAG: hypothetical protein FJX74_26530, partial [Armatimonadetes bacterium]|nr:hypothetical protein [Armatimonadota bacterium]
MTLFGLLAVLSPSPRVQAAAVYQVALPVMALAPTIDGRRTNEEWDGATTLFGMRDLRTGQLCVPQPQVLLGRDAEALYLAASLPKPVGADLKASTAQHDGPLWEDDAVEVFIAPSPGDGRYYQFIVNAAGVTWESAGRDASFDAPWEAKRSVTEGDWTVELRVPFASLGVAPPKEGAVWGVNVGWDRQTPSPAIFTW